MPVDIDALKRFTVGMALEVEFDGGHHAERVTCRGPRAGRPARRWPT